MSTVYETFTFNTINVARAAVRRAEHALPLGSPVVIDVAGNPELIVIQVGVRAGPVREVAVDQRAIFAELDAGRDAESIVREVSDGILAAARLLADGSKDEQ